MPMPVSETEIRADFLDFLSVTVMVPLGGVYLRALSSRMERAFSMLSG